MFMFGPEAGSRHDLKLLRDRRWERKLQENLIVKDLHYCIFGDSAYILRPWIQRKFLDGKKEE